MLALGREHVAGQGPFVILDSLATWDTTIMAAREIRTEARAALHVVLCLAVRRRPHRGRRGGAVPHLPADAIHAARSDRSRRPLPRWWPGLA
jgi:hypothetical protein